MIPVWGFPSELFEEVNTVYPCQIVALTLSASTQASFKSTVASTEDTQTLQGYVRLGSISTNHKRKEGFRIPTDFSFKRKNT
jgi:hypothetical protein